MGQISFVLGAQSFAALDGTTNGRFALAIDAGPGEDKLIRHHVPGVTGNLVVRCGRTSRRLVARVRYRGSSSANALAYYEADRDAWEAASITIVDDNSKTYASCNLVPGGSRKLTEPKATGRASGQTQLDVEYIFTQDG